MRESVIEQHLVKRVKAVGGEIRKVRFLDRRGAPDRLVMLPPMVFDWDDLGDAPYPREPRTIWVELKATGEVPEPHQEREHKRMRALGQRVEVIDSIEGVEELLQCWTTTSQ